MTRALQGEATSVDDMAIPFPEKRIELAINASPILDEQGDLQYAIAAFEDITGRKQMELELRNHTDQLEEVLAERTQELASFLDLTMLIRDDYNLDEVLQSTLDRIIDFGKCQAVCLLLIAEDQAHLRMSASRGLSDIQHDQLQELPVDPDLSSWLADRSKPNVSLDMSRISNPFESFLLEGFQYFLGVQLETRGQTLGLISYYREENQAFSLDDISMLTALSEQLRIVIENNRLRNEIEEIAVVSERQRLARDMHDSINQSLYSLSLFALAGREAAEDGDTERLANSLERIDDIALDARKDMRLLLYQLQTPYLTENNLAEALQQRFDSVERRLDIEVDFQVDGHFNLPRNVTEGLFWTTIEALNNSLQHANTSKMTVCLELEVSILTLKIKDYGRGFDPESDSSGMGLKNMRERVEQLGGNLTISSTTDTGTTVEIVVHVTDASGKG